MSALLRGGFNMDKWERLRQLVTQKVDSLESLSDIGTKFNVSYNIFKMIRDKMEELEAAEGKPCEACRHFENKVVCCICNNKSEWGIEK
jgi:recombinational DNA repair protein RecR